MFLSRIIGQLHRSFFLFSSLILLALPAQSAIVGNVSSWSRTGTQADFQMQDGSRLRIDIVADDLARVRFAPNGVIASNISRAVVDADWPDVAVTDSETPAEVILHTPAMQVVVAKTPCRVIFRTTQGEVILADHPDQGMSWEINYTRVTKTTQPGEKYIGLGWRAQPLVRNGRQFFLRNVARYDPEQIFYGTVPFWYGIRDGQAHGVFFDDTSWGQINTGQASPEYLYFQRPGGQVDYYFFRGPAIADILDRFTKLTGRPYMPPKWSLGYQQCRWSYTPRAQVEAIAAQLRARAIPCDVIYLDIDYMPGGRALTFNNTTFPNPAQMNANLHAQGFRVVANISPFLFNNDPRHPTAAANGHLLRRANGSIHNGWHDYWYFVGGAATGSMAWLDFSRTATNNWWIQEHQGFLGLGIDGIWNDLNEPDELGGPWPHDLRYDFDGAPVNHPQTGTQYALLQTEMSYQALRTRYPDRRPFVLSRGSYAGMQRYAAVWSGDNDGSWEHMRINIPMGLSMSLSGQPHNGHDIGGFFGVPGYNDKPPAELYARWMQWGVFSAFCRQHKDGWGNHDPNRPFTEPWEFGTQVEEISRDFIGLRYRLMPYLYTLAHQAHTSGAPIQRPAIYDFQHDMTTLAHDQDFMFGPWMLVAPVTVDGARSRAVYLPQGADWVHWWDDGLYAGGATHNIDAPLERIPILVRKGAIIPMRDVTQYVDATPMTELTLALYPSDEETSFTLYEDDGLSWDFQQAKYAKTRFTMQRIDDALRLDIAPRQGSYVPTARTIQLRAHRWTHAVQTVEVNGQPLSGVATKSALGATDSGYFHDEANGLLHLRFPDSGTAQQVQVNQVGGPPLLGVF